MGRGSRALALSALVIAGLACGPDPVRAQDTSAVVGSWRADIDDLGPGRRPLYEIWVQIDTDQQGQPFGTVRYAQGCLGVWTNARQSGGRWLFDETITTGRELCAAHGTVELTPGANGFDFVYRPAGAESRAVGQFYRLPPFVDRALDQPGLCDPAHWGIAAGQARDQLWYVNNEPIYLDGVRYVKYGLPRLIYLRDLQPFARYRQVAVFSETGTSGQPDVVYVLVGGYRDDAPSDCDYQPYQRDVGPP